VPDDFALARRFLKVASLVLLISQSMSADATLRPMKSIEQSFEAAGLVARLRIDETNPVSVENDVCGIRYTATILEMFKGEKELENRQIHFGRFSGLVAERTYLTFLERHDDLEAEYRAFRDGNKIPDIKEEAEKQRVMNRVSCDGLVPGLAFDDRFAWPIELNYVIVTGLRPSNMPDNIKVYPTGSAQWWIRKQDLFSYLHTLDRQKH
jgi:hypothetical protein